MPDLLWVESGFDGERQEERDDLVGQKQLVHAQLLVHQDLVQDACQGKVVTYVVKGEKEGAKKL